MTENKKLPKPKPGLKRTINLPSPEETASVEGVIKRLLGTNLDFEQQKKHSLTDSLGKQNYIETPDINNQNKKVINDSIITLPSSQIDPSIKQTLGSETPEPNKPQGQIDPSIYQTVNSQDLDAIGYVKLANTILDTLPNALDPYELVVYLRLYRLSYGFHQTTCLVGNAGLSRATNISDRQVRRALAKLIGLGLIKIVQVFNNKEKQGTLYQILVPVKQTLGSDRPQSLIDPRVKQTYNKIDDDPLKKQDHHQSRQPTNDFSEHEKGVMTIYQNITQNSWTKADLATYQKIKNIPLEAIETAIKLATQRASSRPNSLAFFTKEILSVASPKINRPKQKKLMEKIVERVRNSFIGSNYSTSDFVYKVKDLCLREDIAFDNDLLNEIINKKNG